MVVLTGISILFSFFPTSPQHFFLPEAVASRPGLQLQVPAAKMITNQETVTVSLNLYLQIAKGQWGWWYLHPIWQNWG